MVDRLATEGMDRKVGGGLLCPFVWGLGCHLTQCGLGRGLPPYQVAAWCIQPFGHNRYQRVCISVCASAYISGN